MSRVANYYRRTAEVVKTVTRPRFKVPGWLKAVGEVLLKLIFKILFAIFMMIVLYLVTGSYWIVF